MIDEKKYSEYESSFKKSKGEIEQKPMSKIEREYWDKVAEDPLHYPDKQEIIASLIRKLNKRARNGKFKATDNQSGLIKVLYDYFNGDSSLDGKKGFLISGPYGCGKTEIMKAFCTTHFKPFNPATDKICHITSSIEMIEGYNQDKNFNRYFNNNLYIDDFGSEQRANFMAKDEDPILSKFLELWYMKREHRLFITTNLSKEEVELKYGGRVYSRLHDLCNFITFKEKDFRK